MAKVRLPNGEKILRTYYLSNSEGIFRLAPAINFHNGRVTHINKSSFGEEAIGLPPEMQQFIMNQLRQRYPDVNKIPIVPDSVWAEAVVNLSETDDKKFLSDFLKDKDKNLSGQTDTEDITNVQTYGTGGKRLYPKPADIVFTDPQDAPDFAHELTELAYETSNDLIGQCRAIIYPSQNGRLRYTVIRDGRDKIWIANITNVRVPLTSFGLPSSAVISPYLTIPLWEYHEQIDRLGHRYISNVKHPSQQYADTYGETWKFLREIPIIQSWYRLINMEVPP